MRKLVLIVMAAASYYIAGMYRQMPLMILAVMEWSLLVFLFFLPRCLGRNLELSFPMQNSEAEKGRGKKCLLQLRRKGFLPLKKVCIVVRIYDDRGEPVRQEKIRKTIDALAAAVEFEVCFPRCGIMQVQLDRIYLYDYLSAFRVRKLLGGKMENRMEMVVLPGGRALDIQPLLSGAADDFREETSFEPDAGRYGSENRDIRQIREYHTGDTVRYIHWNQSARTGKLWIKEFEREDEAAFEMLLDMMIPEGWKQEQRDGFYEVVSALTLGCLRGGHSASVSWYDAGSSGFVNVLVSDKAGYHDMMRKLYQSGFAERTAAVEDAYETFEKGQSAVHRRLLRCDLRLACYDVRGAGEEELRKQFTYENLEQELSGDTIFSLW